MRILIHDYAGHAFPISLSRALAARGHEVAHAFAGALQTPRGNLARQADDPPGLEFREIRMDPRYPRYKYSFIRRRQMEVGYGRSAARFIRKWRPDAVLSGNTPTESQQPILDATVASGGRFYFWIQDFYSLAVDQLLRRKLPVVGAWVGAYYRRLDRLQFQRSARVVAITGDFKPILGDSFGIGAEKIDVVPNWALIEELPELPRDNPWARRHGLHERFVFLYSGTIGMKHNPRMLLDLARQHRDDPEVRIVVVSEGIGADWLHREAAAEGLGNLLLLPYQPFTELPAVLATGDVLVGLLDDGAGTFSVPSKTLSYLCAGRPLLLAVPPDNLAARIVSENKAGRIVPPGDINGFLDAARELRESPETRAELGRNARDYAERTFPIELTATTFERILSSTH
ncbi:MAG: glycosyltransferase family 4 protein [Luteolibacter sp.]|jgi:glycosyltransferase involved in cell wall biosynthesis|nr:glycosyltransferase family 4 protein [Luteolibacter sp.]